MFSFEVRPSASIGLLVISTVLLVLSGCSDKRSTDPPIEPPPVTYGSDHSPAWSPDGTRIAYLTSSLPPKSEIRIFDLETSRIDTIGIDVYPGLLTQCLTWSPDGQWFAFVSPNYEFFKVKIDGDSLTRLFAPDEPYWVRPRWSPTQDWIAIQLNAGDESGTYLLSKEGSLPVKLKGWAFDLEWLRHGDSVVVRYWKHGELCIGVLALDTPDRVVDVICLESLIYITSLALDMTTRDIYLTGIRDPNDRGLFVLENGSDSLKFLIPAVTDNGIAWSPVAKRLALTDPTTFGLGLYDPETGQIELLTPGYKDTLN